MRQGDKGMATQVDARGLSCPQPVILTRRAIDAGEFPIEVLVETVTSRENVRRMAEKAGCTVGIEETNEEFKLLISK
jgi:tRNA 2-thiouridine synthesizing protein A